MSEEEIIDKINYMINNWYRQVVEINIEWIQGLLDLYNKEKNKNRKLDRESKVKQTSDEFTEETRYYTPEGEIYETIIKTYKCPKNYISKDKIREKIKEYKKYDNGINYENEISVLQELLEEGDDK